MARRYSRSRRSSYRRGRGRSIGHERALEHIREAEELSKELGGTDKDVKKYFFSLPLDKLKVILDEYEDKYGSSKREYAEAAFSDWKYGRKKMSGLVAGRLYSLLPPRMPLDAKYRLVENLWESCSPRSHKVLRIGPDAHEAEIECAVRSHIMGTVNNYDIPDALERRFKWLSMGDVEVKEQLLNYLLDMEKEQIISGMRAQAPVMLRHL